MNYLLVWDIDGTLIQSRGVGRRALDKAFLDLYGIENGFEKVDMAGRLDSLIIRDAFALHGLAVNDYNALLDLYFKYLREEIAKINMPLAAPGIAQLLPLLESQGCYYNVLGTGNIERGARIKLENDDLNKYFPTGGFGDSPLERWQIIEKAIINAYELFGIHFEKENTYVIGDTPRDMECGKKLGIKAIGTATGPYSVAQLLDSGADFALESLIDPDAFQKIFHRV
ncbi:MAG: HAD hydrolase-like protein [Clostridia bacterium]|nr:HAD hydrolase-like protein [Clostridia bacterium]